LDFNLFDHAVALIILVVLPLTALRTGSVTEDSTLELPPKIHFFYTNGLILIVAAMLILTSWNISPRSWDAMGFDLPIWNPLVLYLTIALAGIYLLDVVVEYYQSRANPEEMIGNMKDIVPLTWREFGHFSFLAFSAGICEEIIFRGFLTTYLFHYASINGLSDTAVLAIAVLAPALSFAASHAYQGIVSVLKIFVLAVLFGLIFLISESLLIVIIVHTVIDLVSGLMTVVVNQAEEAS